MTQLCIKSIVVYLFFFFNSLLASAQFTNYYEEKKFIDHLTTEKLYKEKLWLLNQLKDSLPIIQLEKAWTYHQNGQLDTAAIYYQRVNFDTISLMGFQKDYLSLLFRMNRLKQIDELHLQEPNLPEKLTHGILLMKLMLDPSSDQVSTLPDYISNAYSKYYTASKKSAFLAGSLSAIIPGTGKMYIGRREEGLNMLLMNLITGIQAYESYRKSGLVSPRFIVFGGAFTVFYLSNIYGSIKGTQKLKKDYKQQLHYEISNYYLTDYTLHPNQQ